VIYTTAQGESETLYAIETGNFTGEFLVVVPFGFITGKPAANGKVEGRITPELADNRVTVTATVNVGPSPTRADINLIAAYLPVKRAYIKDANGDGRADYSVITVISQQGAAGAHDEDLLGTITVYGNLVRASDISTDAGVVYGAYERIDELPAGVHFDIEDDGILVGGASNGGHHMT
jgi:hypothetical protein